MVAYDTDLAFVHDAGFLGLAESGAELALELLAECPDGPVLELGCGSGATAAQLLGAGREVSGWDISAGMIEIARRRAAAVPENRFGQLASMVQRGAQVVNQGGMGRRVGVPAH